MEATAHGFTWQCEEGRIPNPPYANRRGERGKPPATSAGQTFATVRK
jgi:hypothetical protein